MQLDVDAAIAAIIARLQENIQGVTVQRFPRNPGDAFKILTAAQGEINVRYNSGRYAPPIPNPQGVVVQRRDATFQFLIRCRDWHNSAPQASSYELMEKVSKALMGWTLPGVPDASKFQIGDDGFIDIAEDIWVSQVMAICNVPHEEEP